MSNAIILSIKTDFPYTHTYIHARTHARTRARTHTCTQEGAPTHPPSLFLSSLQSTSTTTDFLQYKNHKIIWASRLEGLGELDLD